jgi:hypothetical protein
MTTSDAERGAANRRLFQVVDPTQPAGVLTLRASNRDAELALEHMLVLETQVPFEWTFEDPTEVVARRPFPPEGRTSVVGKIAPQHQSRGRDHDVAQVSADGRWRWDGKQWIPAVSSLRSKGILDGLRWWQKAVISGLVVGCFPVLINIANGQIAVGHNLEIVLFIMFPTVALLATVIAALIFLAIDRNRVRPSTVVRLSSPPQVSHALAWLTRDDVWPVLLVVLGVLILLAIAVAYGHFGIR